MKTILGCLGQYSCPSEVLWPLRPPAKAEPGGKREHGHRQPQKVTVPTGAALQGVVLTVFLPHQRAARYMAKVPAAAGGSILLPKIVQAEFCANFRQAQPRAREGPLTVTVVPAGVKLGSS